MGFNFLKMSFTCMNGWSPKNENESKYVILSTDEKRESKLTYASFALYLSDIGYIFCS